MLRIFGCVIPFFAPRRVANARKSRLLRDPHPSVEYLERRRVLSVISNGGFEQPTPLPHVWGDEYAAGSNGIPGWTVVSGSVNIQSASWFDPYQGAQSLDLDGSHPGSIQQSFATTIG